MLTLYQMLAEAQNGQAVREMARFFGLSQEQAQTAMDALLPAFSQGLKRNACDPYGIGGFMQALASGQHARYFEDASRAFSPEGMAEGDAILSHLFGSKELSRAVAAQAAQATGIAQQTLQQMLPAIAAVIMGGLYKQTTGQIPSAQSAQANPFLAMMEAMMRSGAGQASGGVGSGGPFTPFSNPWTRMMEGMFGGGRKADEPERLPSGRERNTYDDLFGQMFETGRQTRADYEARMSAIFDQFLKDARGG